MLPAAEELILADGRVQAGQAEMALVGDQAYPSASARRRTALARHFTHAFVNFFPNTIFSCFVCLLYGALSKIDGSLRAQKHNTALNTGTLECTPLCFP